MKPEVAVFSKSKPVSKVEIYNAFTNNGRYVDRSVAEAQATIGANAPKYLIKKGLVTMRTIGGVDTYSLTKEGRLWLIDGITRYLTLHPERVEDCIHPPPGFHKTKSSTPAVKPILRRTHVNRA